MQDEAAKQAASILQDLRIAMYFCIQSGSPQESNQVYLLQDLGDIWNDGNIHFASRLSSEVQTWKHCTQTKDHLEHHAPKSGCAETKPTIVLSSVCFQGSASPESTIIRPLGPMVQHTGLLRQSDRPTSKDMICKHAQTSYGSII